MRLVPCVLATLLLAACSAPTPAAPAPATPTAAKPAVPAAPPNAVAIPPPAVVVPTAPPPPPPPVPVADDAPDAVASVEGGVQVTFGHDRSDLNRAAVAAIEAVAAEARAKPGALDLTAYAAGTADDPSTPRRLSLARALAVRAVLLRAGIESPRIYVRAEGASPPSGPADRVDLVQEHAAAPVPAAAQASPAPPAAPAVRPPARAAGR